MSYVDVICSDLDLDYRKITDGFRTVVELILEGNVTNWSGLMIKSALLGIELDDTMFVNLLKLSTYGDIYSFVKDGIDNNENCERYFNSKDVIGAVIENDGVLIRESSNGKKQLPLQFDCVVFLDKFEQTHPKYFLKYFLNTTPTHASWRLIDGYVRLLHMVIRRTRLRGSVIERYNDFLPWLDKLYSEYNNTEMFIS